MSQEGNVCDVLCRYKRKGSSIVHGGTPYVLQIRRCMEASPLSD